MRRQVYSAPARAPEEAQRCHQTATPSGIGDILADSKSWLAQLIADAPHRRSEMPQIESNYVRRAIEEIERLRAKG